MSIIKTITLEKSRSDITCTDTTIASVEFNPGQYQVALTSTHEMLRHYRPGGAEEAWQRDRQILEVSHRITAGIQQEISEALSRLDSVVRSGEAITLRIAR